MSCNKSWSTKVDAKLLSDLVIFLILSCDIPFHFHDSVRVEPIKYLMYLLACINTK